MLNHKQDTAKGKNKMHAGVQVIYIPSHAKLGDESCETGFVTKVNEDGDCFCRYWSKIDTRELRTTSCSELTPLNCLLFIKTRSQDEVDQMLEKINGDNK